MPNAATLPALVETATKCRATAASSPQCLDQPVAGRAGIAQRLEGREGLGGDDEERLRRIEVAERLGEIGAIHVRDEAEGEVAPRECSECLVGHHRAQVGAADADVHDVADGPAGVSPPGAVADLVSEAGHAVEHLVDLRDHVLAVDADHGIAWCTQRRVQDRAILGDVDVLAAEHGLDALDEASLPGEVPQQPQGLVGDAVLGVVEEQSGCLQGQPAASLRVIGEQLSQVTPADVALMLLQGLPGRTLSR